MSTLLVILALTTWAAWRFYHRRRSLFANIPGPPPSGNWMAGHLTSLFNRRGWDFQRELMNNYGQVVPIDGMMGDKWLIVFDPVALHNIIVKDQHIYEESAMFLTINELMFGKSLLATVGEHHRKQRKLLNPVFSTNHMRHMYPIFCRVTERLRDAVAVQVAGGPQTVDMLRWMTRAALEIVGQGGLGHSFDPLLEDSKNNYAESMKSFGPTLFPMVIVRQLLPHLVKIGPSRFRRWVVDHTPYWRVQKVKGFADMMHGIACQIFEAKKSALAKGEEAVVQQVGEGKDIISKLLQANMVASEEDRLPDSEVLAQISSLVFAAMDTTSSALAHILHVLAEHPDAQARLRKELIEARKAADTPRLSYDQLSGLPYLDAVCRETLRLYAPLIAIARTTRKDVVLPLGTPVRGKDGSLIHEIPIPNNVNVLIGILASNRNPALWGADSDEWKPERWLQPLPEAVTNAHIPGVYSNLMTFLGGGRSCIGFKFSQMEMKVILAILLESFTFEIPSDLPAPIVWNLAGIQYPSVGYESEKGQLPLKVTLVQTRL